MKFLLVFLLAPLTIPLMGASAISCIEPFRYGDFQDDVFPAISNPECKNVTLLYDVKSGTDKEKYDSRIEFQVLNKLSRIVPHSTIQIMIKDGTTILFTDVFHTHYGYLNIYLQHDNQTTKWNYVENPKDKSVDNWRFNNDETYVIQTPRLEYGRFNVETHLLTVYDDAYNFSPKETPKFEFQLLVDENGNISNDRNNLLPIKLVQSMPRTEDYVKYDYTDERFTLPAFIKKIPLPSDIRQSMLDWCTDSPSSLKNNERFWDAVPIRILSATAEFQFLHGKTDSFIIHSYVSEDTCPPNVWMVGTFASENGDKHKFSLFHDGDFFRYQIGETQCKGSLVVVIKSIDGSPACVKPETKEKLIERGWGMIYLDKMIKVQGAEHSVKYRIDGNTMITDITYNEDTASVMIKTASTTAGNITIELPRTLIDSGHSFCDKKYEKDVDFIVLVGNEEVYFKEIATTPQKRTLSIPFQENTVEIEIIAICLI